MVRSQYVTREITKWVDLPMGASAETARFMGFGDQPAVRTDRLMKGPCLSGVGRAAATFIDSCRETSVASIYPWDCVDRLLRRHTTAL